MKKKAFKAESKRLLDLMINSIYTHKEIFLREIISNASDAIDKLCYLSLTDDKVGLNRDQFEIKLSIDKERRLLTVSDNNGIGMSQEELENNLGVIASSGSLKFRQEVAGDESADTDIIGQFGVGFYSSFMVAKEVTVTSRAYGEAEAFTWKSDGIEGYTIEPATAEEAAALGADHGTSITLHLKDNADEEEYDVFLDQYELQALIKQYSNYVRYPIHMEMEERKPLPKPEDAGDDYKPEFETVREVKTINSMIPIWKRRKSEVTDEEYATFYKTDFHDFEDPARTVSVHAEGALTYDALLFIPKRPPYDFYNKDYEKGLALYSSNVLIMEKCGDLLPDYFSFVKGVVDSQDLSLNISRETLQHNGQLRAIRHEAGLLESIQVGSDSLPAFIGPFQQIEGLAAEGRLDGGVGRSAHHLHDKRALAQRVVRQSAIGQQGGVGLRVPVVEDAA